MTIAHTAEKPLAHALAIWIGRRYGVVVAASGAAVRRLGSYNRICTELAQYSNRELKDMGITRGDIRRIAREGNRQT